VYEVTEIAFSASRNVTCDLDDWTLLKDVQELHWLEIKDNPLRGNVPSLLGALKNLEYLDLTDVTLPFPSPRLRSVSSLCARFMEKGPGVFIDEKKKS
jgi:hypothetical protein